MNKREAIQLLFPDNATHVADLFSQIKSGDGPFKSYASHTSDRVGRELGIIELIPRHGDPYLYKLTDKGKQAYARWLLLAG